MSSGNFASLPAVKNEQLRTKMSLAFLQELCQPLLYGRQTRRGSLTWKRAFLGRTPAEIDCQEQMLVAHNLQVCVGSTSAA